MAHLLIWVGPLRRGGADSDRSRQPHLTPGEHLGRSGSANDDEAVEGWHAGRAVLDRLEVAEVAAELLSAFSRTVLNTTTSGCAPSATEAEPASSSRPAMRSESCTFILQP
jgi:hypothetical protein